MMKLFTESRHVNCDVILANHEIGNLFIDKKTHITDYALWAPMSEIRMKLFWD